MTWDIIIMGAGPAGFSSAIYAARGGLSVLMLDKGIYGGQVSISNEIENYPGIKKTSGPELAMELYEQATNLGVELRFEEIIEINLNSSIKHITTKENEYKCKTFIIANGVNRRKLECPGEEEFIGRGVSYCATCDGAFYKGKDVIVVGGGNTALEDALFLSNNCKTVYIAHRRNTFRGEKRLVEAIKAKHNIVILYNCIIEEIHGDKTVSYVKVKDLSRNQNKAINVSGVFISIGMIPDNTIFNDTIEIDKNGYIISDETCKTNVNGVFVAGDTRTKSVRQIVTACADGAIAAINAASYLNLNG